MTEETAEHLEERRGEFLRRMAATLPMPQEFKAQPIAAVVRSLIAQLRAHGIAEGIIDTPAALTIGYLTINYRSFAVILDDLAQYSGCRWDVDGAGRVSFVRRPEEELRHESEYIQGLLERAGVLKPRPGRPEEELAR